MKLQYFGNLMRRVDSLEKTLMLGGIGGRRRRGWSPTLRVDSLPAEPQGKPKKTGVGSLSLLQRISPTQESNWDLLHCRWILNQLSYQGSPPLTLTYIILHNSSKFSSPRDSNFKGMLLVRPQTLPLNISTKCL